MIKISSEVTILGIYRVELLLCENSRFSYNSNLTMGVVRGILNILIY